MSQIRLLRQRRFGPFFGTQFLGAFNDNLYKNAVVILIAFSGLSSADADALVNLAAGIFILPFFLFSATSGQLADKLDKSRLIRGVKLAEIAIMLLAAVALSLGSVPLLLTVLFLLGAQSTIFGPAKYSILPQHLRPSELVGGNGLVEMGTFLAILIGTMAGGLLVALRPAGPLIVAGSGIAVALCGWLASRGIPPAPAADPGLRVRYEPVSQTWRLIGHAREEPTVWLAILANSWFWFYGAVFLAQFPGYARSVLGAGEQVVTLMLIAFSVGIGVGSTLCDRLSRGRVDLGVTLFGAIGLTLFAVDLYLASPPALGETPGAELVGAAAFASRAGSVRIVLDLVLIGVFGGFFIVPLYALMQHRSSVQHRSRVIAANNVLNAAFMVAASLLAIVLRAAGLGIAELLLAVGALNALVAALLVWRMPSVGSRFLLWLGARLLLRMRASSLAALRAEGPMHVVCPRSSPHQALLLAAVSPRAPRIVVPVGWLEHRAVGWLLRAEGATERRDADDDASVADRLAEGELVVDFGPCNAEPDARSGASTELRAGDGRPGARALLRVDGLVEPAGSAQGWLGLVARHVLRPIRLDLALEGESSVADDRPAEVGSP